jgi:hypothetical protein
LYFSREVVLKAVWSFNEAQKINSGLSVCIFPEGGVPDDESILLIL